MNTVQWKLPSELSRSTDLYAVLDGGLIPDIARGIYQHDEAPEAGATYQGTELNNLMAVSPWVVRVRPESNLEQWIENDILPLNAGLLFTSDYSLEENRKHWGWLRHLWHTAGSLNLGRLHDPRIMKAIMAIASEPERAELMGTVSSFWIAHHRTGDWCQYHNPECSNTEKNDFYRLSEPQLEAMSQVALEVSAINLSQHIETYFPERLEADRLAQADRYISQARELNFTTIQDHLYYTNILCLLGESNIRQGRFPEIHALLTQSDTRTPSQRVAAAAKLAQAMAG